MLIYPLLVFLFILILFSGMLSAAETSFFSLSSMKVRSFEHSKDPRSQMVARLLSKPRKLLVTILMLNIFINILVQNVVSSIFSDFSGWLLSVGVPIVLTLIFGEVIPKSVALPNNTKIAYFIAPFLTHIEKILGPIRDLITSLTNGVSRVLFFFLKKESSISLDELKVALRTSKEFGFLHSEEAKLVRGYLNLDDHLVKEIMRPRQDIVFYNIEKPLDDLIYAFVDQECSRVPICQGSLEDIIGIMTAGAFFLHKEELKSYQDLMPYLQKPFFVPENTAAQVLLSKLYEKEEDFAVIVDEYGSTSGLITLEDLLEVVVGQIADRRDQKEYYTKAGENVIIASGKLELGEFEEIFELPLLSPNNMATLGGWLTEMMGDIPKEGEKYVTEDFLFHVLAADDLRVRRVYVRRLLPTIGKKRKR